MPNEIIRHAGLSRPNRPRVCARFQFQAELGGVVLNVADVEDAEFAA